MVVPFHLYVCPLLPLLTKPILLKNALFASRSDGRQGKSNEQGLYFTNRWRKPRQKPLETAMEEKTRETPNLSQRRQ